MTKRILIVFTTLLLCAVTSYAQKPKWIDYSYRNSKYPVGDYLLGYASSENTDNEPNSDFLNKMAEYARKELVNMVHQSIKAQSEMNLVNHNTETDETYTMNSITVAKAEINGMTIERYYDKKTKEGFAFAFAKRSEVISYYKGAITQKKQAAAQKATEGDAFRQSKSKNKALEAYYACMPIFRELEEAQAILLALGVKEFLFTSEINAIKLQVNNGIDELQKSEKFTLDEMCYFMAYGCFLQTGQLDSELKLGAFTYKNTEMKSAFSEQFALSFEKNLIDAGKYQVRSVAGEPERKGKLITGTYWESGEYIKVVAVMRDYFSGKSIASAEGKLPLKFLADNKIDYIPENFARLALLDQIALRPVSLQYEAKVNQLAKSPLRVLASYTDANGAEQALDKAPLCFVLLAKDQTIANTLTNANGEASVILSGLSPSTKVQLVEAKLDVAGYLGLDTTSIFYKEVVQKYSIPSTKIFAKVLGLSVYIDSQERGLQDEALGVKYVEPKLKEALSDGGYNFVSDMKQADYYVSVDTKARTGREMQGLHFSFVDVNVSVTDIESGKEIYKNAYADIKGGSSDYKRAMVKAYGAASEKITAELLEAIAK